VTALALQRAVEIKPGGARFAVCVADHVAIHIKLQQVRRSDFVPGEIRRVLTSVSNSFIRSLSHATSFPVG
jgi:hypothetical protein